MLDSTGVQLVWEQPAYPQYYVPESDVVARLTPADVWKPPGGFGKAQRLDLTTPTGMVAPGAAWTYPDVEGLEGLVRFDWNVPEMWLEEDEAIFVHPRSPYVRVDCLHSSREISVSVGGTTVAHSTRAVLLFETGLPTRYYLPPTDVRLDVLRPSDTRTSCPYKGHAEYLSVQIGDKVHDDLAWYYATPFREAVPIAGMIAFHTERCTVLVDGVPEGNDRVS